MIRIILAMLLSFAVFPAIANESDINADNPDSLLAYITKYGADTTIKQISPADWDTKILPNVETGNEVWLQVAEELSCCADGWAGETLPTAISKALMHKPELVLRKLLNKNHQDNNNFSLKSVCIVPIDSVEGIGKKEFDKQKKLIKAALSNVKVRDLLRIKKLCISGIDGDHYEYRER